jgi:hypothetical protein
MIRSPTTTDLVFRGTGLKMGSELSEHGGLLATRLMHGDYDKQPRNRLNCGRREEELI